MPQLAPQTESFQPSCRTRHALRSMLSEPPPEDNGPVRYSDESEDPVRHAPAYERLAPTGQLLPDAIIMLLLASGPTLPPCKLGRFLLLARFIMILPRSLPPSFWLSRGAQGTSKYNLT